MVGNKKFNWYLTLKVKTKNYEDNLFTQKLINFRLLSWLRTNN